MKDLNEIIAENLTELRKQAGLTQQQLAKELNYSDKTISKWELGYAIPSVDVLIDLAKFYGVSLDYIVTENEVKAEIENKKVHKFLDHKLSALLLLNTIVILVATVVFVWTCISESAQPFWQVFIWGGALCMLISYLFVRKVWKHATMVKLVLTSLFVWILITAFYLQFLDQNVWYIFIVGVPVELLIILIARMGVK